MRAEEFEIARRWMLAEISARAVQLRETTGRAVFDERVMAAMGRVPRHEFVPIEFQSFAYANIPLPIGFDKTISQPYVVALMTDLLDVGPDDAVLEIGTGLGYQSAILAQLARKVYSIEIIEELGRQAKQRLRRQGCTNVEEFRLGVLGGAERTLPPWLKVPAKRPQSKSVKTNKIAAEIAIT